MFRQFECSQVYHPDRVLVATGAELGRPVENVFFQSQDGLKLNGWFFPAKTSLGEAVPTVLVCHGNAGNISHRLELCRALLETGINVFVFDYRGYGRSEGRPSEEGTYCDAAAAYDWLHNRGLKQIIIYGESLGGGVAAELCRRKMGAGLVLQSTFTSIPDVGAELFPWLPVRWLATIRYDTLRKLPELQIPVLVMHSRADELIGFRHGQQLFAAANDPKLFWELNGGHNQALSDASQFKLGLEKFLRLVRAPAVEADLSR